MTALIDGIMALRHACVGLTIVLCVWLQMAECFPPEDLGQIVTLLE